MSQPDRAADRRAAQAVVRHHAELAATLDSHTGRLLAAADRGAETETLRHRDELARWLHDELLPHAQAEEAAMYPAAAALDRGKLLVDGMLREHAAILGLVSELGKASGPARAAAAARALAALFAVHLDKENRLIVPLLADADKVSLAGLLTGMHKLIGAEESGGTGGCGGACACGGDAPPTGAEAAVLSIDPRLDVRDVPHARVLAALDALPADGALVLVAPHAPRPLLAEIDRRYGAGMTTEWLQDGPDVWQIRLQRVPARA
ncbi:Uncharacterized conserved protein, DUF2249 family [Micromonospora rhizosphaerae]|uniref:Uncharacterized conserved protein, DUF2249 family n=1 Tax=Micromonospora rhizosphaerae TaxID=568872 RepID=A0A1C6SUN6_9ACTN|nr:DUF2249 domain-containing protein [Micromonospora rhizosphaerae]SCL33187.1 Uncharacterized conserved protein, DUF2249 family [Micromonospora rhizosphaerae]